jgi:putative ABC transport system permease protein
MLARPRRSALAVTTLGVGFGTVLWLWTVAASFEQSVREVLPNKLRGDLSVGSAHLEAGYSEAAMDGALIDALATVPGVAVVVGERSLDWWYAGGPISLDAFDPAYFVDPRFGALALVDRRDADALGAVARGAAVLVSDNFRRNLHVGVGDVVTLDTPTGPLALPIAGVLPDFLSPRGTIDLSRDLFRARWGDDQVVRGLVEVTPGTRIDEVRDTIAARLGSRYGLRVLTLGALVEWFGEQVRRGFAAFDVLAVLVMLVVLVGIGDALAATTLERTREFGMTRALGVRRRVVRRAVVLEGLLLGLLGLALAAGIGLALGRLWVSWTFPALVGWTLAFHLPAGPIGVIAAAVMLVCLLASWVPALRAARLDPVVALRAE